MANVKKTDNILDLNDDCLITIFKYLSLIDLCATAETCKRLQYIAREAFPHKRKDYGISQHGVKFRDHRRILRNFGDVVKKFTCITEMLGIGISSEQMKTAFKWAEKYCGEALESINVISTEITVLPESAMRLMSKVKEIDFMAQIPDGNLQAALLNCKELVTLKLMMYDGPFHFPDHRLPQLRKLSNRVRVSPRTDYNLIETFFKHHTALTELSTQFLNDLGSHGDIDLSFVKHLTNLKKLSLVLSKSKVVGTDAFTHLNNLQELWIDGSADKQTDAKILENLASVDSLVKLSLGVSEVSHLIASIDRFRNLSKLAISEDLLGPDDHFNRANIGSLAQLSNSSCTELQVSCWSLSKPKLIVNVVRNLKLVKTVKLFCEVALSEAICKQLAQVCSSQKRKIEIILDEDIVGEMDFDFTFIDKFNKEFGAFVEIKIVASVTTFS